MTPLVRFIDCDDCGKPVKVAMGSASVALLEHALTEPAHRKPLGKVGQRETPAPAERQIA